MNKFKKILLLANFFSISILWGAVISYNNKTISESPQEKYKHELDAILARDKKELERNIRGE